MCGVIIHKIIVFIYLSNIHICFKQCSQHNALLHIACALSTNLWMHFLNLLKSGKRDSHRKPPRNENDVELM
jgi:hypothetical protein